MKRLASVILFLMLIFTGSISAEIYQIPEDLLKEVRANRKAYEADKNSDENKFNLAMSYAYTGQIKKGWDTLKLIPESYADTVIPKYQAKIKEDSTNWKYPFKLAFGYYFKKDKQKSIDLFNQSLSLNPNNVWTMGFIGLVEGDRGNPQATIDICKKALKIEPNATAIHFLLAEGYRRVGKYGKFMSHMFTVGRLQTEEALVRPDETDNTDSY